MIRYSKILLDNMRGAMDEIYVAEAVFRIVRERRSTIVDVLQYGNVKSMEQYR